MPIRILENTGKYYPPSGWIEEGEREEEALKREVMEELKLSVLPLNKIAEIRGDIPNLMLHFWECQVVDGQIEMDSKELNSFGWFTILQMKNMKLYPATIKVFRDYLHEDL